MSQLGVLHYEPTPEETGPEASPNPPRGYTPTYDLENAKSHSRKLFNENDLIVITEKIHGENWRGLFDGKTLHIGSRTEWKQKLNKQSHWQALSKEMEQALINNPNMMIIGESAGRVKNFPYGIGPGKADVFVFDIYDMLNKAFLPVTEVTNFCYTNRIKHVPILHTGPYTGDLQNYLPYAEGNSTLDNHIREGCVIRHLTYKIIPGHVVPALKIVGIDYLSGKRKKTKET
jgi:ATP-dependent RNA circularization protein (DNA/RNA ligase family)